MNLSDALSPALKSTSSIIPFTLIFNTSLPSISEIFYKYWDLLLLSDKESVNNFRPFLAYRRPKNIRYHVVMRNALLDRTFLSSQCLRRRCSYCNSIIVGSQFDSSITGCCFDLHDDINCTSRNVIYLILHILYHKYYLIITCKGCNKLN
jgi:hypothetical protein